MSGGSFLIIGVGTDLVEIGRVKRFLEDPSGQRFLERVLTPSERGIAAKRKGRLAEFVAGRFAAKEAVVKALGTGIGVVTGFQDIEVVPTEGGRPVVVLSSAALARLGYDSESGSGCGAAEIILHLSITHTQEFASAYVVAELINKI